MKVWMKISRHNTWKFEKMIIYRKSRYRYIENFDISAGDTIRSISNRYFDIFDTSKHHYFELPLLQLLGLLWQPRRLWRVLISLDAKHGWFGTRFQWQIAGRPGRDWFIRPTEHIDSVTYRLLMMNTSRPDWVQLEWLTLCKVGIKSNQIKFIFGSRIVWTL